ncbi:hypothetical protein RsS62_23970 [Rhizobium dioscoreae]|uniref:hypothetical protein n=1 Tax=Rhizobium dioscoreae TaxID=2653122 RepID=UPI001261340B|nr:hypothetical protein [Rhizobium dioscoreae]GES43145.1 hypothetical protein RsS62_23970 [Rhizobium dioscoreae]
MADKQSNHPDEFDDATCDFHANAIALIEEGADAIVVADALITQAMAVWAAKTGRFKNAEAFLRQWAILRDAH